MRFWRGEHTRPPVMAIIPKPVAKPRFTGICHESSITQNTGWSGYATSGSTASSPNFPMPPKSSRKQVSSFRKILGLLSFHRRTRPGSIQARPANKTIVTQGLEQKAGRVALLHFP
jgi:hypothetical protein